MIRGIHRQSDVISVERMTVSKKGGGSGKESPLPKGHAEKNTSGGSDYDRLRTGKR